MRTASAAAGRTLPSAAANFSLPRVSWHTMETSDAASAPESAAALPPPGAGLSDESSARKSLTFFDASILSPHVLDDLLLGGEVSEAKE